MSAVSHAASSDMDRSTSAPPEAISGGSVRPPIYPSLGATLSTPDVKPKSGLNGSTGKVKGMQLGASKVPLSSHVTADWAEEAAAEAEAEESGHANPWGTDDLMDVNADQDDWSKSTEPLSLENRHSYCYRRLRDSTDSHNHAQSINITFETSNFTSTTGGRRQVLPMTGENM